MTRSDEAKRELEINLAIEAAQFGDAGLKEGGRFEDWDV